MAAWSFYLANDYPLAEATLDRFIELNPAHPLVEYAYYLKALGFYEQIVDVERDAEMTKLALSAFEEVVRRFPNGRYARDSQLKIDLTKSHLAGKEMAVGRFYLKREYYTAAIRRFNIVISDFDTTNHVGGPFKLSEHTALGLKKRQIEHMKWQHNYPDSIWTKDGEAEEIPKEPSRKGIFERSVKNTSVFSVM